MNFKFQYDFVVYDKLTLSTYSRKVVPMNARFPSKKTHLALAVTSLGLLVGCGGGGGSASPQALSGRVIDGYIGGATVCLDINANLICDPGEPTTTSSSDGSYTLPAYAGSIDGLKVIAVVPVGATDTELGVITKAFDLLAPAESAATVTPLTTLVANEMNTRKVNAQEAEQAVKAQLNVQADKPILGLDVTKDAQLLKVAQVVTASLAGAKETLKALNESSNLGLSKADIVKAAIQEVKTSVLPQVLSSDGKVTLDTAGKTQAQLIAAVTSQVDIGSQLTGKVQQIVSQSKAGDGTQLNMAEVFKNGLLIASLDSGDYLDSNGKRIGNWSGFTDRLTVEFIQFDASADQIPSQVNKVWLNGVEGSKWYTTYDDNSEEIRYVFDGNAWIKTIGDDLSVKPQIKDNCVMLPVVTGSAVGQKVCAVAKDLSGKKISDFLKDDSGKSIVCKRIYDNASVASCDPEQLFPRNSIAYDLTFSTTTDLYEVWTGSEDWIGYSYKGMNWQNPGQSTPTITAFIEELKNNPQWQGPNCGIGFKVKSVATDGKTGVMEWGENVNRSCNSAKVNQFVETTNFKIETVGGKEVMRVFYPNIYRKINPGDIGANEAVFAVVEKEVKLNGSTAKTKINGVFSGHFSAASRSNTITFNGNIGASSQVVNKTLFEAAIKAMGIGDYPYSGK